MIRVDLYSGLLGAGKTSLIRRMLSTAYKDQLVVIVENEIGRVNFDSAVLESGGIRVKQITGNCICCTMSKDIQRSLVQISEEIHPDVIVIEPTGASDASALTRVIREVEGVEIGRNITVLKAHKCHILLSAGEFYRAQIRCADSLFLNFIEKMKEESLPPLIAELSEINPRAEIVAVPLEQVDENTFPKKVNSAQRNADPARAEQLIIENQLPVVKRDLSLKVEDMNKPENSRIRIRSQSSKITAKEPTIYTWEYSFPEPFSEESLQQLSRLLEDTLAEKIWRVKGIVTMEDGSRRKYDVSFGEVFVEEWTLDADIPENTLVFIGPDISGIQERLKRDSVLQDDAGGNK